SSGQADWLMKKARLALAVAVIKNKPPGQSGREHAEALAGQLRSLDEGWRSRAQGLQQEVLRLRQELLLAKMTPSTRSTREAELVILRINLSMLLHMQFLQSLCGLRWAEGKDGGLEAAWLSSDEHAGSVLVDSVCQLLDSVVAACRDAPPLPPSALLLQACQVAARASDLCCSQNQPSAKILKKLKIVKSQYSQPQLQVEEKLTECLIILGTSGLSKSFLIRQVLSQISGLADQLWKACQKSEVPEQEAFLGQLEHHILHLSNEFPLFALYMWRIGGLLSTSATA
uniref:Meiosis-specific, MEI4 homolog (S. cerevisiae) n=1 Tax=Myripristis murdjan TaxID=586833 RepID=A0A667YZW8_9TELE